MKRYKILKVYTETHSNLYKLVSYNIKVKLIKKSNKKKAITNT